MLHFHICNPSTSSASHRENPQPGLSSSNESTKFGIYKYRMIHTDVVQYLESLVDLYTFGRQFSDIPRGLWHELTYPTCPCHSRLDQCCSLRIHHYMAGDLSVKLRSIDTHLLSMCILPKKDCLSYCKPPSDRSCVVHRMFHVANFSSFPCFSILSLSFLVPFSDHRIRAIRFVWR